MFVFFSHLRKAAAISVKTILSSSSKLRQYETKAKEGECARMVNLFISLSLFLAQKKEDLGGRMTQSPRKVSPPIPLFLCLLFVAKKKEAQRHKTNRRWKGSGRLVKSFLVFVFAFLFIQNKRHLGGAMTQSPRKVSLGSA